MRIAILTYHRAYNCGAMLQAWALKTVLERMGHKVEFPSCNRVGFTPRLKPIVPKDGALKRKLMMMCLSPLIHLLSIGVADISRLRYNGFRRKYLPERACLPRDFASFYDLVVVGSDQVWSERHSLGDTDLFLGTNVDATIPYISYAASYGDKYLNDEAAKKLASSLGRYSALSARENIVRDQMASYGVKNIEVVADPTLLLGNEDYAKIAIDPEIDEDYLYCYSVSMSKRMEQKVHGIAKKLGVRAVITPGYQYSRFKAQKGITYGVSPERLVGYVKNAKYVVALSFHGTAVAIALGKPVLSLREEKDAFESRPASLLNRLGIGDRVVSVDMDIDEMAKRLTSVYPSGMQQKLEYFRASSISWLRGAIQGCSQ